jgi:hypothetical protein
MDLSGAAAAVSNVDRPYLSGSRATRKIGSQKDLVDFVQSDAFASFMEFLLDLNEAVKGKAIMAKSDRSPVAPASMPPS